MANDQTKKIKKINRKIKEIKKKISEIEEVKEFKKEILKLRRKKANIGSTNYRKKYQQEHSESCRGYALKSAKRLKMCEICGREYQSSFFSNHLRTNKHLKNALKCEENE